MRFSIFTLATFSVLAAPHTSHAQFLTGYTETSPIAETLETPEAPPALPSADMGQQDYTPLITRGVPVRGNIPSSVIASPPSDQEPVDLEADSLSYDDGREIVTASGDAFLTQGQRILRANNMAYDLAQDEAVASGNVVLNEANGDIHLADTARYKNTLQDGYVQNLRTTLNDGSNFRAEEGLHQGGTKTVMNKASYTPCEPCKADPEKPPTWGIKAREVEHDKEEHRVKYKDATFEALGVPIMYTPYFSHADGTITQESGFLAPSAGYRSELGGFVESSYYWAIAPDQDATLGMMVMTEQAPLALAEYRKRWSEASLELSGGVTYSDRTESTAGRREAENDELRGHVFANALWDMNDKWRSGINAQWTSDDQYMRQYDFTNEDVLENEIYAERFSGRNYASGRLIAYKDIRIREVEDQPNVVPEIIANFQGEPGAVPLVKGSWYANNSLLGLTREGDEQDLMRASTDLGWKRRFISDYGLLTSFRTSLRADAFFTNDRDNSPAGSGRSRSGTDVRVFPQAHMQTSYPMAKEYETFQAKFEPIFALTAAPNHIENENIPNEDSRDVQIDSSNLFEPNRFPGLDKIEDQSRLTYGIRSGLFGYGNSYADFFIGQSYRLDASNNPFPNGSGLENQESDIVGSFSGQYKDRYYLDYKYQLGSRDLAARRHEVNASADWNRFRLNGNYIFARALDGTNIDETREQVEANAQFYLNENWRLTGGGTHDFGVDPGPRETYLGIDYLGQCLFWSLTGQKNYTNDETGDSGTEILFRIGLKNLGDFETSDYRENEL